MKLYKKLYNNKRMIVLLLFEKNQIILTKLNYFKQN